MPTLELTDRARDDLLQIADYIGEQQHRRSTAKKVVPGILATCRQYALGPLIGESAPELDLICDWASINVGSSFTKRSTMESVF